MVILDDLRIIESTLESILKTYREFEMLKRDRSYEYWKGYLAGIQEAIKIAIEPVKVKQ